MVNQGLIEVVAAEPIEAGVTIVHRRVETPFNPIDTRPYDGTPTKRWPQCIPVHVHGCDNNGQDECAHAARCQCVCTCELPNWWQYSAGWARHLGAVPCPEPVCNGGEW